MKKIEINLGIILIVLIIAIIAISLIWYNNQLNPVNSKETAEQTTVEIETGMRTEQILNLLKENNLIKNTFAAKVYIKLNKVKGLQAGKYQLADTMSLEEILNQISSGEVLDETITITFLEGKNMRWYAKKIAEETNNTEQDVYNLLENEEYLNKIIEKYWFLGEDVLNEDIYYSLEGYLSPNTYTFENADVSVEEIFDTLLNQTETILNKYKVSIGSANNAHRILTIASIIELEGNNSTDRKGISSVIYNRIANNMSIGSDVTTYYAIKVDMGERDLYSSEINTYNPYNTRGPNMNGKLPVGPIAAVSEEAIEAALNPENTNYLYFVADINGNVHFAKTYEEHKQIIQNLQKQGLWYEYDS